MCYSFTSYTQKNNCSVKDCVVKEPLTSKELHYLVDGSSFEKTGSLLDQLALPRPLLKKILWFFVVIVVVCLEQPFHQHLKEFEETFKKWFLKELWSETFFVQSETVLLYHHNEELVWVPTDTLTTKTKEGINCYSHTSFLFCPLLSTIGGSSNRSSLLLSVGPLKDREKWFFKEP